jgi:uncharacterized protein (DUF2141 family)
MLSVTISLSGQQWLGSNVISGTGTSSPTNILKDALQNAYICGTFASIITYSQEQESAESKGFTDIFLAKYNDSEQEEWFKTIGGNNYEGSPRIVLNGSDLVIGGTFSTKCYFSNNNDDYIEATAGYDVFLATYDATTGALKWKKNIVWGAKNQSITSLQVDDYNNIIVAGYTNDNAYFTNDVYIPFSGGRVSFVAKFDNNGNYLWHSYIIQAGAGSVPSITSLSNTYFITGTTRGETKFVDQNVTPFNSSSTKVYFYVAAIDGSTGSLNWVKTSSGNSPSTTGDESYVITNNTKNLYVSGVYCSVDMKFDDHSLALENKGKTDIFIMELSPQGVYKQSVSVSSNEQDMLYGLEIDGHNLYIAGSIGGPVSFNQETITPPSGKTAMFIALYELNDTDITAIGAVEGVQGVGKDVVTSPQSFKLTGTYNSTELELDATYYNGVNPPVDQVFFAKACPIIAINDNGVNNVTGCDPLAKNGSIILNVDGGAGPYTYTWQKNGMTLKDQTASTINKLDTGKYSVTVSYNNGFCSKDRSFTITAPDAIAIKNIEVTSPACGATPLEGAIQVTLDSGDPANLTFRAKGVDYQGAQETVVYDHSSSDGASYFDPATLTFRQCPPGRYVITVAKTDDATCYVEQQTALSAEDTNGSLTATITQSYQCSLLNWPDSVGEITVSVQGVGAQEWYAMIDATTGAIVQTVAATGGSSTSHVFSKVAPGKYNFKAGKIAGCHIESDKAIPTVMEAKPAIMVNSVKATDVLCYGAATGKITVKASGGSPLQYILLDSNKDMVADNTSGAFQALTSGVYHAVVKDAAQCTDTSSVTVHQPASGMVLTLAETHNSCSGGANGQIVLKAENHSGYATYTLTPVGGNPLTNSSGDFTGLAALNYAATVYDQYSKCTAEYEDAENSKIITVGTLPPITFTATPTPVRCHGESTGDIEITAIEGGSGDGYKVDITDGINTWPALAPLYKVSNLTAGTYTVTVTDSYNCSLVKTDVTINNPAALTVTRNSVTDIVCYGDNNGKIIVTGTGGTSAIDYTFILSKGGNVLDSNQTGQFEGLSAGSYVVKIIDDNGCEDTTTPIVINQPGQPMKATLDITNVKCHGAPTGKIEITQVENGTALPYGYVLHNSEDVLMSAESGAAHIFANLPADTYRLTITDGNQCRRDTTGIVVTEPPLIKVTLAQKIDVKCFGDNSGSIRVSGEGGEGALKYSISSNPQQYQSEDVFIGLPAGTYTITARDDNGCEQRSDEIPVGQPEKLVISNAAQTKLVSCRSDNDGSITVGAEGGAGNYQYRTTATDYVTTPEIVGLSAAEYTIMIKDGNECEFTGASTVTVRATEKPDLSESTAPDIQCFGDDGRIIINAVADNLEGSALNTMSLYWIKGTGDTQYETDPKSEKTFNELNRGTYTLSAEDSYGCIGTQDMRLDAPDNAIGLEVKEYEDVYGSKKGRIRVQPSGGWLEYTITCYYPASSTTVIGEQTGNDTRTYEFLNLEAGDYKIVSVDAKGCQIHVLQPIKMATNVLDFDANSLKIFPNPSRDGQFIIEWGTMEDCTVTLEVSDINNKQVRKTEKVQAGTGVRTPLDLGRRSSGTYLLRVRELKITRKLVIE